MKFDFKLFLLLGLIMTATVAATTIIQDQFLNDAVGAGDIVIGGFGIPLVTGFVITTVFMILWKYILNKEIS